jgi:branched-chain amino acid transport system permease protein
MTWLPWVRRAALLVLVALVVLGPPFLPSYYVSLAGKVLLFAIFAMSLDILLGYTGLWSFGHAAFFGIGAYAVGLFTIKVQNNFWLALAVTLVATAILAALFGFLVLRAQGVYFMMLTLALAQVVWGIAFKWRSVTGGDDGLPAILRPDLSPLPISVVTTTSFYTMTAIVFIVLTLLMFLITRSPFGQTLEGIRENEVRMSAMGYNVWLHKYLAYVLSGVFAGCAGMMFAYYNGIVSPTDVSVVRSAEALLMVVLGGSGTLFGSIVGAAVVVLLQNLVGIYTERWLSVLGIVYVLTVLFAPQGVYVLIQRGLASRALGGLRIAAHGGWSKWLLPLRRR